MVKPRESARRQNSKSTTNPAASNLPASLGLMAPPFLQQLKRRVKATPGTIAPGTRPRPPPRQPPPAAGRQEDPVWPAPLNSRQGHAPLSGAAGAWRLRRREGEPLTVADGYHRIYGRYHTVRTPRSPADWPTGPPLGRADSLPSSAGAGTQLRDQHPGSVQRHAEGGAGGPQPIRATVGGRPRQVRRCLGSHPTAHPQAIPKAWTGFGNSTPVGHRRCPDLSASETGRSIECAQTPIWVRFHRLPPPFPTRRGQVR